MKKLIVLSVIALATMGLFGIPQGNQDRGIENQRNNSLRPFVVVVHQDGKTAKNFKGNQSEKQRQMQRGPQQEVHSVLCETCAEKVKVHREARIEQRKENRAKAGTGEAPQVRNRSQERPDILCDECEVKVEELRKQNQENRPRKGQE